MTPFPPASSDSVWRCVRTKPKSEHLAAHYLAKAGFESYCPRLRHQKRTTRGPVWFVEALFPSYAFCRFPLDQNRLVRATHYVAGLLDFTPGCGIVAEDAINDLRNSFSDTEILTVYVAPVPGETVELADGAFRGVEAVVTKLIPGTERVQILMDFLGSQRQMEVPLHSLLGFHDPRVAACAAAS